MSKLSKENRNKIIKDGIYKVEKPWLTSFMGTYHHMNWCFMPVFAKNGDIYMVDTYFSQFYSENTTKLTDENIDLFEFKFVKGKYSRACYDKLRLYDEKDIVRNVAVDSGGYSCKPCDWVRNDAKVNKDKLLASLQEKLESAKNEIDRLQDEIIEVKEGTHWKLKY